MLVQFYDEVEDELLKFVVIVSKYQDKWVFCKHKERNTYELPGGHREDESIDEAAIRELKEETGALTFDIEPVCVYSVTGKNRVNATGEEQFGMLYYADITSLETDLHSEIEQIYFFDQLPKRWTYPKIQPLLIEEVERRRQLEHKLNDSFVKGVQLHNQTIYIEEYQEEWPLLFEREKKRLLEILKDNALAIEHIGSTAIPGLAAKPIIDILLLVEDAKDEATYLPALESHGYTLKIKEPDFEMHHMFKGPDTDINLHVYSKGATEANKNIMFRNYLRTHPKALKMYENEKKRLAKRKWKYVQNYADAKSEVVNILLQEAMNFYENKNEMVKIKNGVHYIDEMKQLIIEYTNMLQRDLSFQQLDEELNDLAFKYSYPHGRMLIAFYDNQPVGCVAFYQHNETRCEMKRLYVKDQYRHLKIGEMLVNKLLDLAKEDGYKKMVLDTITPLTAAIHLYHKVGFKETKPYYNNPMDDVIYMKKEL